MKLPIATSCLIAKLATRIAHPRVVDRTLQSGLFLSGNGANKALFTLLDHLSAECVFTLFFDLVGTKTGAAEASIWGHVSDVARGANVPLGSQVSLAQVLAKLAANNPAPTRKVALLLAHADVLLADEAGHDVLRVLKAARDEVNLNGGADRLYVIGASESPVMGERLVSAESAFYRAPLERLQDLAGKES
jgi:hypothetical protein